MVLIRCAHLHNFKDKAKKLFWPALKNCNYHLIHPKKSLSEVRLKHQGSTVHPLTNYRHLIFNLPEKLTSLIYWFDSGSKTHCTLVLYACRLSNHLHFLISGTIFSSSMSNCDVPVRRCCDGGKPKKIFGAGETNALKNILCPSASFLKTPCSMSGLLPKAFHLRELRYDTLRIEMCLCGPILIMVGVVNDVRVSTPDIGNKEVFSTTTSELVEHVVSVKGSTVGESNGSSTGFSRDSTTGANSSVVDTADVPKLS